ncbi:hypothetical protein SANTM175S_07865 [Streptomyces antimycoticus]
MLGVPGDALVRFAEQVPAMSRCILYGLLLTNVTRENVVVLEGPELSVATLDWTSASYGDPLHGLASHVVGMRYRADQVDEAVEAWVREMRRVRPLAVSGLTRDLPHYIAFERIHSAYDDVISAANSLGDSIDDSRIRAAAVDIGTALEDAAELLGMSEVPPRRRSRTPSSVGRRRVSPDRSAHCRTPCSGGSATNVSRRGATSRPTLCVTHWQWRVSPRPTWSFAVRLTSTPSSG